MKGLQIINKESGEVILRNGDPKNIIDKLVARYERLFGRASQEVCREAAASIITSMPRSDIPTSLLA